MVSVDDIRKWFSHHEVGSLQQEKLDRVREAALDFAKVLLANVPAGPDQTAAIRHVRDAMHTANASIAMEE